MSVPPFREFLRPSVFFFVAVFLVLGAFYWLYLSQISTIISSDGDGEAWDNPLTVAHLERAREHGVSAEQYFKNDPIFENIKQQDPHQAFGYYGHRFRFEFFAFAMPLPNALYIPFVKILGVGAQTVAAYSNFFSLLAIGCVALLALKMFGRWHALLSCLLMLTSLSWLIHTQAGHASWMPSAVMINGLVLSLYSYMRSLRRGFLVPAAFLLGLMYLLGWISVVFGILIVALTIALEGQKSVKLVFADLGLIIGIALITVLAFTLVYATYYHCGLGSIHRGIFDGMFGRFTEGGAPNHPLSIGGKLVYAFKCMAIDSQTFDHTNKYLEGKPAIPYLFTLFFFVGLLYCIKDRFPADRLLLIWLVAVFGFLGSIFTFTHRYALMGLPAMGIVAARGIMGLYADLLHFQKRIASAIFALLMAGAMVFAFFSTHRSYYVDYMLHKPPDFDRDRGRGQSQFATWLKKNCPPAETLVVMSDPIMFPHVCLLFNAFGYDYKFVYWNNYFGTRSTVEQVKDWEKEVLSKYRKIVFAFSTQILGDQQRGGYLNDWRPFVAAHPGMKPQFAYSYSGRPPLFYVFEVRGDSAKPPGSPGKGR